MMKHIVLVGPRLACTDGMIFEGSQYLFKQAGISIDEYLPVSETPNMQLHPFKAPTHIVVLGTPWVWDKCWLSPKYANLQQLFDWYPTAKRLFLGVGACLPIDNVYTVKYDLQQNVQNLSLFQNATVLVRDINTSDIVPGSIPLPCPAFWALKETVKTPKTPTMIWYDPTQGLSRVSFQPKSPYLAEYIETFQRWNVALEPAVYCVAEIEKDLAVKIGLPVPKLIEGIQHAKLILSKASILVSGRVHLTVPAADGSISTTLVPVDSRIDTLKDYQMGHLPSLDSALEEYKKILTQFASEAV